ncbi:hypothetical protein K450DRAFT_230699 [Umbelopsis ramanniana AG]|uniref:Glutamine amidotransferase domain-containing protein n=1 Tax=Umbelopsis ramanniana AG TaxID=1314678 RepID=A0AAD5ED31_UMBRA|nr:uncharacterized protein K450DRAFT_230699 [Umbelopsis ramanniana AG]KAI8581683.1 hypothetical protein K450DRAFT_230699 [Umbelopsis ramanniana AG]
MTSSLHLALLICDTPTTKVVENYGAYDKLFRVVFDKARPADVDITWSDFDVVTRQEHPSIGDIQAKKYDGIVITGSARGAYEDEEWIHKLIDFVKQVREQAPQTRMVGICFGHQIIAIASGGACKPNPSGWEFGYTDTELTPLGRRYFNTSKSQMAIQEVHKDYVPELPPNFKCLATTAPHTPVQAMVSDDNRVISVQGHPEFPAEVVELLLEKRLEAGILKQDFVQESLKKLYTKPIDDLWIVQHFISFLLGKVPAIQDEEASNPDPKQTPAATLSTSHIRLTTAAGEVVYDPSAEQIFDYLSELNMRFSYLVVERLDEANDQYYMLVNLNDDDSCLLEYKFGSADAHFQTTITGPFAFCGHQNVAMVVTAWATGKDELWKNTIPWNKVVLD